MLGCLGRSYCPSFGPPPSPASTFCGLYCAVEGGIDRIAEAVRSERGYGVFVAPRHELSKIAGSRLLEFSFPSTSGHEWGGAFMSFAFAGKVRRRRPETFFALVEIPDCPSSVGLLPFCPARQSPLARRPSSHEDTVAPSPPFDVCVGVPPPSLMSSWDAELVSDCARSYPCRHIAKLACEAVTADGVPSGFAGDRLKCVVSPNLPLDTAKKLAIKQHLLDEVGRGRMLGPFPRAPFPNEWCPFQPRNVPLGTVPKDKWDPTSSRFRLIGNLSARKPASVNSLVFSPKIIQFHPQAAHFRDMIASTGRARLRLIDHHDAFRANASRVEDMHLFCYKLDDEWFIDLRHCFGSVVSEWAYDSIGAVLHWGLGKADAVSDGFLMRYVDNWNQVADERDEAADGRWVAFTAALRLAGCDLHEEQDSLNGPVSALGWQWRADQFWCPPAKLAVQRALVADWHKRASAGERFSALEVARLLGLFQWVVTAAPAIKPQVAHIRSLIDDVSAGRRALQSRFVLFDALRMAAVDSLFRFFQKWDGSAPVHLGFSPVSDWEVLFRTDASTDDGAGGFALPSFDAFMHAWTEADRQAAGRVSRESTMFLELRAVQLILLICGRRCRGKRVQFEIDSEPAVRALSKCFSPEPGCMELISDIILTCATLHIYPRWEHIGGVFNVVADSLSHLRFSQAASACKAELGGELRLVYDRR